MVSSLVATGRQSMRLAMSKDLPTAVASGATRARLSAARGSAC